MPIFIHSLIHHSFIRLCSRHVSELEFTELDKAPALDLLTVWKRLKQWPCDRVKVFEERLGHQGLRVQTTFRQLRLGLSTAALQSFPSFSTSLCLCKIEVVTPICSLGSYEG